MTRMRIVPRRSVVYSYHWEDSKFRSTNSGGVHEDERSSLGIVVRRERDRPEERVGATTPEENRWGSSSREDAGVPLRDRCRETTTTPRDTINGRDEASESSHDGSSSTSPRVPGRRGRKRRRRRRQFSRSTIFQGFGLDRREALELDGGGECVSGFLNASAFLSHVSTIVNIMLATPRVVLSATWNTAAGSVPTLRCRFTCRLARVVSTLTRRYSATATSAGSAARVRAIRRDNYVRNRQLPAHNGWWDRLMHRRDANNKNKIEAL